MIVEEETRFQDEGKSVVSNYNYFPVQIRRLVGAKLYIVNGYRFYHGSYPEPTVNEKNIICKIDKLKEHFYLSRKSIDLLPKMQVSVPIGGKEVVVNL